MDSQELKFRNEALKKYLASLSREEIERLSNEEFEEAKRDFQELKLALEMGKCSMCGQTLTHFSEKKPCFHWLLNPKGFKKKHFPLLYQKYCFHKLESYLRWVANADIPLKNINDLVEEKGSSKKIEITIRYKNLEWSFSCSDEDFKGHANRHEGTEPHYHFQMKVNNNVMINYSGFHIPFHDEDFFTFSVKDGEFEEMRHEHIEGAGMQTLLDNMDPEEIINNMRKTDDYGNAMLHTSTIVQADPGTTISGETLTRLVKEHNETGVSMAKLLKGLPNAKVTSIISPGPGVPEIAKRASRRKSLTNGDI